MSRRIAVTLPFLPGIVASVVAACGGTSVDARPNGRDPALVVPADDNPEGCPPTPDGPCDCVACACVYGVPCQSGTQDLRFTCADGRLELVAEECAPPFDYCPAVDAHCRICLAPEAGGCPTERRAWKVLGDGSDDPVGCPWDRPAESSACRSGYYDTSTCGYPCDDPDTWTVAICDSTGSEDANHGHWRYDGACD